MGCYTSITVSAPLCWHNWWSLLWWLALRLLELRRGAEVTLNSLERKSLRCSLPPSSSLKKTFNSLRRISSFSVPTPSTPRLAWVAVSHLVTPQLLQASIPPANAHLHHTQPCKLLPESRTDSWETGSMRIISKRWTSTRQKQSSNMLFP